MIIIAVSMILVGTASIVNNPDDTYADNTNEIICDFTSLSADYTVDEDKTLIVKDTIIISGNVKISGGGIIKRGTNPDENGNLNENYIDQGAIFSVGSNSTLTLEDITIDGGAIWSNDTNIGISSDEAAIRIEGGSVLLKNNAVIQNNDHSSIRDNPYTHKAMPRYYNMGGGIAIYGGSLTMEVGSSIHYNSVTNNNYTKNNEGNSDSVGGGVSIYENGSLIMNGGTISNNRASVGEGSGRAFGGGVGIISRGANEEEGTTPDNFLSMFEMNSGIISGNYSHDAGGGLYASVDQGDNQSDRHTHLIMTISGKISYNTTSGYGGGIQTSNSTITLSNGAEIEYNKADGSSGGGGLRTSGIVLFTASGGSVKNNETAGPGGGIYFNSTGEMKNISSLTVTDNEAGTTGGGISIYTGAEVHLNNCTISNNKSITTGGGIHSNSKTILSLIDCSISDNNGSNGDGVYMSGEKLSLSGIITIYNNDVDDSNLYLSQLTISIDLQTLNPQSKIGIIWNNNGASSSGTTVLPGVGDNFSSFVFENTGHYLLRKVGSDGVFFSSSYIYLRYNDPEIGPAGVHDGELVITIDVIPGEKIDLTELSGFTKDGYHVERWGTNRVGQEDYRVDNPYVVPNNTAYSLFAIWTECSHQIQYETNDGSLPEDYPVNHVYGVETFLPIPTRMGYTFQGWYDNSGFEGGSISSLDNICIEKTKFYAKWIPISYKILFDSNSTETSGNMSELNMTYDVPKSLSNNSFTLSGYDFKGWMTTSDGSTIAYVDGETVNNLTTIDNDEITLYAKWDIKTFNVSFLNMDGTRISGGTYNYNTTLDSIKPKDPSIDGLTFTGWTPAEMPEKVTSNLTFTATFKIADTDITVEKNSDGKTVISSQDDDEVSIPTSVVTNKDLMVRFGTTALISLPNSVTADIGSTLTLGMTDTTSIIPSSIKEKVGNDASAFDFMASVGGENYPNFTGRILVTIYLSNVDVDTMVFYLNPNGSIEKMHATDRELGVSITFETDHFSTYVATGVDLSIPDPVPPSTSDDDDSYQQWLQQYYQQIAEQQKQQQALKEQQEQKKIVSVAIAGIAVVMLSIAALMVTRRK